MAGEGMTARALAAYARSRTLVVLSLAVLLAVPALGGSQPTLLGGVAVVLAGALALATASRPVPVPVLVRMPGGRPDAQAPTPYWRHLPVARRPIRPRAPGTR